jgi:hypothetical protein
MTSLVRVPGSQTQLCIFCNVEDLRTGRATNFAQKPRKSSLAAASPAFLTAEVDRHGITPNETLAGRSRVINPRQWDEPPVQLGAQTPHLAPRSAWLKYRRSNRPGLKGHVSLSVRILDALAGEVQFSPSCLKYHQDLSLAFSGGKN